MKCLAEILPQISKMPFFGLFDLRHLVSNAAAHISCCLKQHLSSSEHLMFTDSTEAYTERVQEYFGGLALITGCVLASINEVTVRRAGPG